METVKADNYIELVLIKKAVELLKPEYPEINEENILTDKIHTIAFQKLLKNNIGNGQRRNIDEAMLNLCVKISEVKNP